MLLTGANGNLVATADGTNITYDGKVGTDYYYEEDGGGKVHTGGGTFSSVLDKTYNFGQQPFAISGYDDSQVWSDDVDASSFVQNPIFTPFSPKLIFTENPPSSFSDNIAVLGNGTITFNPPIVAPVGSKIYVNVKGSGSSPGDFTTNSGTYTCPVPHFGWVDVGTTLSSITLKNSAAITGDYFSGVRIDDAILVDTGNPIVAAQANTLFQKWSEWNNVSMMLATNPAHVARFNTMKAAMEAFPAERTAFRRSMLTSIASSGLTAQQKVYLLTEGADGTTLESGPFAKDGYFPLYDTEEVSDSVSTNGESHSHTFDGVTYYMPDEGTTLYHGNY